MATPELRGATGGVGKGREAYPAWGGAPLEQDDSSTVNALVELLRQHGGRRPASAVGYLYNRPNGELHRQAIRSCGGVARFVSAHSAVFAMEPASLGDKCPSISLRELVPNAQQKSARLCRFYLQGRCDRGSECRFSHVAPAPPPAITSASALGEESDGASTASTAVYDSGDGRRSSCSDSGNDDGNDSNTQEARPSVESPQPLPPRPQALDFAEDWDAATAATTKRLMAVRSQVMYYLSDANLRNDSYMQSIITTSPGGWVHLSVILGCRRMQKAGVTLRELLDALRHELPEDPEPGDAEHYVVALGDDTQLREAPSGQEAVRRKRPPLKAELPLRLSSAREPSLAQAPLEFLCHKGGASSGFHWHPALVDAHHRSFCYLRRNTYPAIVLRKELQMLRDGVDWFPLRGKSSGVVTRSTAWFVSGGCQCNYAYGDVSIQPMAKPPWLDLIEQRVLGHACGLQRHEWPNSLNMNLYEDDNQSVGWHSDDEGLFGGARHDCRIISASWGEPRTFEFAQIDRCHASGRTNIHRDTLQAVVLFPGDLLSMEGLFQKHYSHQIAKGSFAARSGSGPTLRINLTWRYIVRHKGYCPMAARHAPDAC